MQKISVRNYSYLLVFYQIPSLTFENQRNYGINIRPSSCCVTFQLYTPWKSPPASSSANLSKLHHDEKEFKPKMCLQNGLLCFIIGCADEGNRTRLHYTFQNSNYLNKNNFYLYLCFGRISRKLLAQII